MEWKRVAIWAGGFLLLAFGSGLAAQSPSGYVSIPGRYIFLQAAGDPEFGHTAGSCAARCDQTTACLSFELRDDGRCSLNNANRRTRANILSRSSRYTYYERRGSAPRPNNDGDENLYIFQICGTPVGCAIGVADASFAVPGNARYRDGWRRLEGPFSTHPSAWLRACGIHYSGTARADDITNGAINCRSLGWQGNAGPVPPGGSGGREVLYVFQICGTPVGCAIGVADASFAVPGNARYRDGWRRLEGPFSTHPSAWLRACEIHYSGAARADAITNGVIDCEALVWQGGTEMAPPTTRAQPSGPSARVPRGYISIPKSYIWGQAVGEPETGHTAASCASRCDRTPACISFEFRTDGRCSMNSANRRSRADILSRSDSYTYYEKTGR